ncbi:MAG TPA: FHA domain-containing protein [Ktedonobacteraceae bacterium]|nr:FHA domain-containing protein [Ktedonobacteraceae bacterium]
MITKSEIQKAASITFLSGPLTGRTFEITKPITTIGRHTSNDIPVLDEKVSRYHAQIIWNEGIWSIENLSQTNPATVDGQSIEKAIITHSSTIGLGKDSAFLFILPTNDELLADTEHRYLLPAIESPLASKIETMLIPHKDHPDTTPQPEEVEIPAHTAFATYSVMGISSIEVTENVSGHKRVFPLAQEIINIGRNDTNDIVIDDPLISDWHLQIVRENNAWVLIHPHPGKQQTNASLMYQGRKIRGNKTFRRTLTCGDVFRITDEHGNLITLTYNDGTGTPQMALPLISPIPLHTASLTLGRLQDNDVVLNHPQVSAHHARLTSEAGTYRLTDLHSSNRTYVNGLYVSSLLLKPDDEIRIGPFKLTYTGNELRQCDESGSIGIDALELKKVGNNQVVLLDGISLSIPPRSFIALVGSSGTGKSTLMDALSGLRPAQQGAVYYNGKDYYAQLSAFRSQLGYVPQEDIIHRDLTVEKALYYAAKLRLPADFTDAQIEQRIDEVLEDVEMTHRRTLLIKKLSGGQRKRISIALELLAKPSIFFLDEPTSGLDPGLDRKMMVLLRKLADKGHTIILVTHATNNINICDAVCFLAQGGRLAYFGPPDEAKTYFQQPDFAEIYNCLEPTDEQPDIPQQAEKRFRQSAAYQQYVVAPLNQRERLQKPERLQASPLQAKPSHQERSRSQAPKRGNAWKQFIILCQRYVELLWNDKWNLAILLLQAPVIGFILFILVHALDETRIFQSPIPSLLQGDAQRFLFILSFASIMFGCINSAREIIKEVHIYQRERTVNLGIMPYLFSKIVVLGVLCLLQCAVLLAIMSLAAHFYAGIILPAIWEVYITLALTSLAGVMVGLTISALVHNNDQAMSFIPLLLIPQVIFSGSMFALKGIPLQTFGALFSLRWSMAALGSILNLEGNGDKVFGTCAACNTYQHNAHYLLITWLALIASILVLALFTACFLKRKDARG